MSWFYVPFPVLASQDTHLAGQFPQEEQHECGVALANQEGEYQING